MGYSLGFWLEDDTISQSDSDEPKNSDEHKNKVELHINYWSLEAKQACNYLDIGLRLNLFRYKELKSINFYFPFKMEKENYMGNLGNVICSKDELIELIFNEKLKSSSDGVNYKDIRFLGDEDKGLRVYKELEIGDDPNDVKFIVNEDSESTKVSIPKAIIKHEESDDLYHYFRFRLKLSSKQVRILSQNYEPEDRLVVSKFEKIEVIDFRLNELRDLPATICNHLNNNFILEQIHLFIIRDIHDELKLSHDKYKRCRLLEKEVWNEYLHFKTEKAALPTQMLIYHFDKKDKNGENEFNHIDRFNAFAKFVRVKVTFVNILAFVFSVIILGSLGSLIATVFIESRPNGIYFWAKHWFFHFFIGLCMIYMIYRILHTFWKGNFKLQWPIRRS